MMCKLLLARVEEMLNYCVKNRNVSPINKLVDIVANYDVKQLKFTVEG